MIKQTNIVWPEKFLPPEVAEEVRLVPLERTNHRPLYVSQNGKGFSCHVIKDAEKGEVDGFMLRAIKDEDRPTTDPKRKCKSGNYYRHFSLDFHHILVHRAVLLAWVGPCPKGCQCDHLNGDNTDNRLENLQWVTPRENQRRAGILKVFRKQFSSYKEAQEVLAEMTRKELLHLFAQE